ncbi:MAG TPA: DUF2891 domain-containing protein [Myxococcales bacterium]|jgi:hypothetical protein
MSPLLPALLLALALRAAPAPVAPVAPAASPAATDDGASRFAKLALDCASLEYPNKLSHTLASDADVHPPRELTPAFFGCYDWHSSVHGHWLLARLARLHPKAEWAAKARGVLASHLTPEKIAAEARYLQAEGRAGFERPYGLAWLLALAGELRESARDGSAEAKAWSAALAPLERVVVDRLSSWLPKLTRPVRSGEHSQTAFALGLALDWSQSAAPDADVAAKAKALGELVRARARSFYEKDRACPLAYEPSGEDFLSPCLAEADVMRRVLPAKELSAWLDAFFPADALAGLEPAVVSDRADPKLVHLDGLNLSRAFMLEGVAAALPAGHRLRKPIASAAAAHRAAGLAAVTGEHYMGGHWLGSFATYLVTGRGLAR